MLHFQLLTNKVYLYRCPQHYKAFYRLGYHFLKHGVTKKQLMRYASPNAPPMTGSTLCKQLLMTTYNQGTEAAIQGLFSDRKPNNFFNVRKYENELIGSI